MYVPAAGNRVLFKVYDTDICQLLCIPTELFRAISDRSVRCGPPRWSSGTLLCPGLSLPERLEGLTVQLRFGLPEIEK